MRTLLRRQPAYIENATALTTRTEAPTVKGDLEIPRYTLRVEEGLIRINNISATPEKVTYTLMAQKRDGSTQMLTKHVALAPFQVVEDDNDGNNVLAAWTKN